VPPEEQLTHEKLDVVGAHIRGRGTVTCSVMLRTAVSLERAPAFRGDALLLMT